VNSDRPVFQNITPTIRYSARLQI